MTRDAGEAAGLEAGFRAQVGAVSRWGRITDTLLDVETETRDFGGRPLYIVKPIVGNRDPLFDA
jgi:hypothetical protein